MPINVIEAEISNIPYSIYLYLMINKVDALLIKWYGVKLNEVNDDMIIINDS